MNFDGTDITEDELRKRCLNEQVDNEAWGYLRQYIYSVVFEFTYDKNDPDLEDKTQMVLGHIYEKIKRGKFNSEENFYWYVYKITRHKVIDWTRSAEGRKIKFTDSLDEMQGHNSNDNRKKHQITSNKPTSDQLLEKKMSSEERMKAIRKAIEKLENKEHRKAIEVYLSYRSADPEVATYDDIAKILKLKKGTASSLIFRILKVMGKDKRLKKLMES